MKQRATETASPEVDAFEALTLGDSSYGRALETANRAVAALAANARAKVFPLIDSAIDAEAIAVYEFASQPFTRQSIDREVLELHGAALTLGRTGLAGVIRTRTVLWQIDAALAGMSIDADVRNDRICRFCSAVARQLLDAGDKRDAVIALGVDVSTSETRIAAVVARHDQHADNARQTAEAARLDQAERLRRDLIAEDEDNRRFFSRLGGAMVRYRDDLITGSAYAERVLAPDANGEVKEWRRRHAAEQRRLVEPSYRSLLDPAPEYLQRSIDAEKDLSERISRISDPVFSLSVWGGPVSGSKYASNMLAFAGSGRIEGHIIRSAVAQLRRVDPSYRWPLGELPSTTEAIAS